MLSLQTVGQAMPDDTPQYRPAFHFSPQRNWMNDPNGLVFADGVYHLFFQYHPDGLTWGPMHWGHTISRDLLHWEELPIALYPDALGMIFSGSIVIDKNNTSGLGCDGKAPWVTIFTHHDPIAEKTGDNVHQYQSIAFSVDDGASWTKYAGNPVLPNPGIKNFRDPKVFWHAETGSWVMSLAAGERIVFYSSPDLKTWALESELGGFEIAEGNVLECPDLVPLDLGGRKRWVLIVSVVTDAPNGGSGTRYIVGDFDGRNFVPEHQDVRWLDYGPDNYAGVTFHNTGDQVLLIGWMSNWAYAQSVPTAPWRSAMTLPRSLGLVTVNGKAMLSQSVPMAFKGETALDGDWHSDLSAAWREVDGVLKLSLKAENQPSFELTLGNDLGDRLVIGFNAAEQHYYIDRCNAGQSAFSPDFPIRATAPRIAAGQGTDIELYFDNGSVELFADDGTTTMTSLFFPRAAYDSVQLETGEPAQNGQLTVSQIIL
jgi:fructan beta-fructosidase